MYRCAESGAPRFAARAQPYISGSLSPSVSGGRLDDGRHNSPRYKEQGHGGDERRKGAEAIDQREIRRDTNPDPNGRPARNIIHTARLIRRAISSDASKSLDVWWLSLLTRYRSVSAPARQSPAAGSHRLETTTRIVVTATVISCVVLRPDAPALFPETGRGLRPQSLRSVAWLLSTSCRPPRTVVQSSSPSRRRHPAARRADGERASLACENSS